MATEQVYSGNNSTKTFSITFPYLKEDHVNAKVGGTDTSAFTISGTNLTFTTAPPTGTDNVVLYRDTPIVTPEHTYQAGTSIRSTSLNDNQKQALYAVEEAKLVTVTSGGITTGAKGDIRVNSDSNWVITDDAVEKAMMADNSVGTAQIETNAVTADEIAANAVGASELADNAVDTAAIVNNAVTSDKVTPGGFNPVGTVIWYAGSSAPAGYLKANGDAIANGSGTTQSITADFSALYAIVGANLPDLRGEFIRGWDDSKGTDSGRGIRTSQSDQNKQHNHTATSTSTVTDPGHSHVYVDQQAIQESYRPWKAGDNDVASRNKDTNSATTGITVATATTVANTGGTEARPRNIALLACIKY